MTKSELIELIKDAPDDAVIYLSDWNENYKAPAIAEDVEFDEHSIVLG